MTTHSTPTDDQNNWIDKIYSEIKQQHFNSIEDCFAWFKQYSEYEISWGTCYEKKAIQIIYANNGKAESIAIYQSDYNVGFFDGLHSYSVKVFTENELFKIVKDKDTICAKCDTPLA